MLNRNFTFCEHPDTGMFGLKADWMPNADPFDGVGCAHDMLEHFATETSAIEGELQALGAFLYLRLENGWALKYRSGNPESWFQLGSLLSSVLVEAVRKRQDMPTFLRTKPLSEFSEERLQLALTEAFSQAECEFEEELSALEALSARSHQE